MTSSGMKRGLAVTAISALSVTGLPLLAGAANAVPLSAQQGTTPVVLQTGAGMTTPGVSVHNDGVDTVAHLVATAQANVTQVEFSYVSGSAAPVSIAKVASSNGAFSTSWDVPAVIYNTNVTLQAQGFDKDGNSVAAPVTRSVFVSPTATAVNIANAAGSTVNVFQSPYAAEPGTFGAVAGTTSEDLTKNDVTVNGSVLQEKTYGKPANGISSFSGIADFGPSYDFGTATDADQALIHAVVAGSDDNEPVVLKQQQITDVTATAAKSEVPVSNPNTKVTVTVKDQNGNPIYGAQVVDETDSANPGTPQYTDSKGQTVFSVSVPSTATSVTKKYTVNTDDTLGYDSKVDFQKTVTVSSYSDSANSIVGIASDLGPALDSREYNAHPVKVQVNDNKGAAENGQTVKYSWTVKPFDSKASVPAAETGSVTTATDNDGVDGTAVIPAPTSGVAGTYTLNAYQELDGNPGQTAGDRSMAPMTLKLGTGTVNFADGSMAQEESGTSKSFDAKLTLEDGTPLAGRTVTFGYSNNGGNAALSKTQPGNTVTDNTGTFDKTDSNGLVSVSVTDPNEPPAAGQHTPAEKGGVLSATPAGLSEGDLKVDWLRSLTPVSATFGGQHDLIDSMATPGRPVSDSVSVYNADGDKLTDQTVTLNVDHGSFTPYAATAADLVADPAAADGGQYGEWKSSTNSIKVTTDDSGVANYTTNIERDKGFDDDGAVAAVTSVAGIKDATDTVNWDSGNKFNGTSPLNPGTVKVQLADTQDVSIVKAKGLAPLGKKVFYDIVATDQFGNRVEAPVDLKETSTIAGDNSEGPSSSNFEGDSFWTSSDAEGTQSYTATWNAETNKYGDTDSTKDGVQLGRVTSEPVGTPVGGATKTDTSAPLTWYKVDLSKGQFTVTHTGANKQAVGNVVTETYKAADQNGEPVQGLQVRFFRSGPDNMQGGDGNGTWYENDVTDGNGLAAYDFQGTKTGQAVVTGIAYSGNSTDGYTRLASSNASDTVSFAQAIHPSLGLSNQKNGADVAAVNGPTSARGAMVKLYKVVNGKRHFVASKHADNNGNARFVVADAHRSARTTYVAQVGGTSRTFSAWTPKSSIK